jgi:hypothetical protein
MASALASSSAARPGSLEAEPPRHSKRREGGRKLSILGKKLRVDRICAGIAALDIIDAEPVQQFRDHELVVEREIDAVGLCAVAQRRVEQVQAFAGRHVLTGPDIRRRARSPMRLRSMRI